MRYLIGLLIGILTYAVTERRNINRLRIQERITQQLITAQEIQMDLLDEMLNRDKTLPPAPDCDNSYLGPFEDFFNGRDGNNNE